VLVAARDYAIDRYGIDLDQYAADQGAQNNIKQSALFAPTASFMTVRPLKQNAPKKPSILGPILSGITTTVSMGTALGGKDYFKRGFGDKDWGWQPS
jgi:hypothetical protein